VSREGNQRIEEATERHEGGFVSQKSKLFLVGDFRDNRARTENYIQNAFQKALGWKVETFSYRERAALTSGRNMNALLAFEADRIKPDVMLLCGADFIDSRTIAQIRQSGVQVAWWYFDFPKGGMFNRVQDQWEAHPQPDPWHIALGRECTAAFFTVGDSKFLDKLRGEGVNAHHLLQGCDPMDHGQAKPALKTRRVVFVGELPHERWHRRRIVDGTGAETFSNVFGEKRSEVFGSAKINLNVQFNNAAYLSLSARVFTGMASGTFNLHQYVPGMEALFERGVHCDWFNSLEEANQKIVYYDAMDVERETAAKAGRKLVLEKHTYKHRVQEMLDILNQQSTAGAIPDRPKPFTVCVQTYHEQNPLGMQFREKLAFLNGNRVIADIPTPDTDVIVSTDVQMVGAGLMFKSIYPHAKWVVMLRDVKPWTLYDQQNQPYVHTLRAAADSADRIVVPTEKTADEFEALFHRRPEIKPFWFSPPRKRRADTPDNTVVFVGRFSRHKLHGKVLYEVAELPEENRPRVVFIGWEGETVSHLKSLAKHLGVEVELKVNATDEEKWDELEKAAVFVNPSGYDGDGSPAMLEAAARGVPVKTSIHGEPLSVKTHGLSLRSAANRFMSWFKEVAR
jgi:hypothetical protein